MSDENEKKGNDSGPKAGAQKSVAEAALDAKEAATKAKAKKAEEAAKKPPKGTIVVSEGRSVTSKRGLLDAGTVVNPGDFFHGKDDIAALVKSGVLTEVK